MGATSRVIALSLITSLLVGGPVAPLAHAQSAPPVVMAPAAVPPPPPPPPAARVLPAESRDPYETEAVVADIFYVPGKGILCGLGVTAGVVLMLATFGTAYRAASEVAHEGCGGSWTVKADDLRPQREVSRAFEWETHRFEWEPELEQTPSR